MNDVNNASVWSIVRKSCHERLVRVFIYLNQNSLCNRKKTPPCPTLEDPFQWRRGYGLEAHSLPPSWGHRLAYGEKKKGSNTRMIPHWCSLRQQKASLSRGSSRSQRCWLRWRVRTRCQTGFLWRRKVNSNRFLIGAYTASHGIRLSSLWSSHLLHLPHK